MSLMTCLDVGQALQSIITTQSNAPVIMDLVLGRRYGSSPVGVNRCDKYSRIR